MTNNAANSSKELSTKGMEIRAFLVLAVVLAPFLSIAVVGGLGLVIWVYQILVGPPSSPSNSSGGH